MASSRAPADPPVGGLAFVWLGAVSMLGQTLLVRETLFAFHGGEIGLGLFYALWVAGIAGGAALGARGCRRWPFEELLVALVAVEILALFVMRHHRLWIDVPSGGYLPAPAYVLLLLATVVPAGVLTGVLFPVGLQRTLPGADGVSAGGVGPGGVGPGGAYALESLGSMAGGAAAALYLLPRFGSLHALWIAGMGVWLWILARRAWGRATKRTARLPGARVPATGVLAAGLLLAASAGLLSGLTGRIEHHWLAARWRGLSTGGAPILQVDTPYHHLTVAASSGERALYLNGLYQGNLADAYVDSLTAALVAGQHPAPRHLYVIAPAFYGPLTVLAGAEGVELIVLRLDEQLDRALGQAGSPGPGVGAGGRDVRFRTGDPRHLLRSARPAPDLIWVTGGGPTTAVGNRLYTVAFFERCARSLAPGGALLLSLAGAANVPSPEEVRLRASVYASLSEVFGDVRALPGEDQLLMAARPRGEAVTARGMPERSPLTTRPDSLSERRTRRWPSGRTWPEAYFTRQVPPARVAGLQASLEREARTAPLNTDWVPSVFFEQLRRWDRLAGGHLAPLLTAWRAHPWRGGALLLLAVAAVMLLARRGGGQPAVSMLSTGLCGMGWNLLVLLLYQTQRGALYLKVGLINGLFMLGLALGAWAGGRLARGVAEGRPRRLLGTDLAWLAALGAALFLLPRLTDLTPGAIEATLLVAAAAGGVLTGLPFPIAARAWRRRPLRVGGAAMQPGVFAQTGGAASAADHGGAIAGALLTGSVLVPLIGFTGTLLFLLLVKAASALSGVLPGRGV